MSYRFSLLALPLLLLPACDMTVEVQGLLGGIQALAGSMTLYSDGGTIELYGDPKTHCLGNFDYRRQGNEQRGEGTLVCDDRRMGPFSFAFSGPRHGVGHGTLGGIGYSFRF